MALGLDADDVARPVQLDVAGDIGGERPSPSTGWPVSFRSTDIVARAVTAWSRSALWILLATPSRSQGRNE